MKDVELTGMLRVGKGKEEKCVKIWCQKCWELSVSSLEDRVKELDVTNLEYEEQDSFKECNKCNSLKSKVEKYGVNSSNDWCSKLEDEIVK